MDKMTKTILGGGEVESFQDATSDLASRPRRSSFQDSSLLRGFDSRIPLFYRPNVSNETLDRCSTESRVFLCLGEEANQPCGSRVRLVDLKNERWTLTLIAQFLRSCWREVQTRRLTTWRYGVIIFILFVILTLCSEGFGQTTNASCPYSVSEIADAIKKVENSKNHPYGILKPYCSEGTESRCRKGCVQTIERALKDWNGQGDFLAFLAGRYAPIGVANDPNGLNKNWLKNLKMILKRGAK